MAVFTPLDDAQIENMLLSYDLGQLTGYAPIPQGVENSNFHLHTTAGHFILSVFEGRTQTNDLPFFFSFMNACVQAGVNCPQVVPTRLNETIVVVAGKPAAILTFLSGRGADQSEITADICRQMGDLIARLHDVGQGFECNRANTAGIGYWRVLARKIGTRADDVQSGLTAIIAHELNFLEAQWPKLQACPQGVVHADLFPDNVFVNEHHQICGVIDFYFSCTDILIYDLAITLNAWCFDDHRVPNQDKVTALLSAYWSHRPFTDVEYEMLNIALRGAALRFLMSRLHDWLFRPADALVTPKDPLEYLAKLQFHQHHAVS